MSMIKSMSELKRIMAFMFIASMLMVVTPAQADDPPPPAEELPQ